MAGVGNYELALVADRPLGHRRVLGRGFVGLGEWPVMTQGPPGLGGGGDRAAPDPDP